MGCSPLSGVVVNLVRRRPRAFPMTTKEADISTITREDTAVYSGSSTTLRARSALEAEQAAKRRADEAEGTRKEQQRHEAEIRRQYAEFDRRQLEVEEEAERRREESRREQEQIEREASELADEMARKARVTRRAKELVSERSFGTIDGASVPTESSDLSGAAEAFAYEDPPIRLLGPPEPWVA